MSKRVVAGRGAVGVAVAVVVAVAVALGAAGVQGAVAKPAPKPPKIKVPAAKPTKPAPPPAPPVNPVTRVALGEAGPANAPGQQLYLQEVTIQPGAALPTHLHEGTQVATVRSGVLTYTIVSGAATVKRADGRTEVAAGPAVVRLGPGDGVVETPAVTHYGANDGKVPVVILLAALLKQGAPLATAQPAAATTPVDFALQLTSQDRNLKTAGASGQLTYGWNRLTGTAAIDGGPAQVEMQASVDYASGSGDFFGFVTATTGDGSTIGLRMTDGRTTASADGTNATFVSTLRVIGGTGRYANAKGFGSFTGSRTAALGGVVEARFHLDLG